MNYNQQSFLPTSLLDDQEPQPGNFPPLSLNRGSQPNDNLLGLSFPDQTQQQKKLREQRQKRSPNLQAVLQATKTQSNFANNASQPRNKSVSTPPRGVRIDQTVRVFTPNRNGIKKIQTSLKHSQRADNLARDDSYSTLGDDSRIQKFESILQRLEMVLVDLLQNTQRLRRV